jgi:glutamate racemase
MTGDKHDARPIALLDSGVGGLSILREVRRLLPNEGLIYFADQANVPYGPRPLTEIRALSEGIVRFLLDHHAKIIVVACNAASAASLHYLRDTFPGVPFVGMEPAVKPAANNTQTGIIGVITTEATFQGQLFASVVGRFAQGVQVETQVCPDFVTLVEEGALNGDGVQASVRARLEPLLAAGIDQLVLGCTHFPFLSEMLAQEAGPGVTIVDPGPAVARQVTRVVQGMRNGQAGPGRVTHFTTGDLPAYTALVTRLLGAPPADARHAHWHGLQLQEL